MRRLYEIRGANIIVRTVFCVCSRGPREKIKEAGKVWIDNRTPVWRMVLIFSKKVRRSAGCGLSLMRCRWEADGMKRT